MSFCFVCLQIAIMSGHFELGEIIKNHKDSDIGTCHTVSSEGAVTVSSQHLLFFVRYLIFALTISLLFPLTISLISPSISPRHIQPPLPSLTFYSFLLVTSDPSPVNPHTPPSSVPFLESPKYVPKRKESAHTLPLPSLHSHPLLRANSDNSMTQSDPLALPNKAATNPNPGQVLRTIRWMLICSL